LCREGLELGEKKKKNAARTKTVSKSQPYPSGRPVDRLLLAMMFAEGKSSPSSAAIIPVPMVYAEPISGDQTFAVLPPIGDELAAMGIMVADDNLAPVDEVVAPPPAADASNWSAARTQAMYGSRLPDPKVSSPPNGTLTVRSILPDAKAALLNGTLTTMIPMAASSSAIGGNGTLTKLSNGTISQEWEVDYDPEATLHELKVRCKTLESKSSPL
jgi:hypothetical protein